MEAHVDNALEPSAALLMERHGELCPACAQRLLIALNLRRAVLDHLKPVPAPARLKRDLRTALCPSSGPRYVCYAVLPAMLILLVGAGYMMSRKFLFPAPPHPWGKPSAAPALVGRTVIEGEFLCVRCEGNEQGPKFSQCADAGHAYAVKAKDGVLWLILPGPHLEKLIDPRLPFHTQVRIAGNADPQNHAVELTSINW